MSKTVTRLKQLFFFIGAPRGWTKEVGVRAELRDMLVRAIAIAIAYISLWSVQSVWFVHVHRTDILGTCTYHIGT